MIEEQLQHAIDTVNASVCAYCHYITPNDVGVTGGHQYGFTFSKHFYSMFFDTPGEKGANKDIYIKINWQGEFSTESRVIYYGVGTRNEYRITRFGRGFEFLQDEYVGSLMIMTKDDAGEYNAYVLSDQSNIEDFMAVFSLDVTKGNQWIERRQTPAPDEKISDALNYFASQITEFPDTVQMAEFARKCVCNAYGYGQDDIAAQADMMIQKWVDAEYKLFANIEEKIYKPIFSNPFSCCQDLISFANTILNRRKSRAGKSLEHHLASIFTAARIKFEEQVVTEGHKRPDFIFPDGIAYHDFEFPADKLTFLGAKTTCKDRWRQVLNEADRIDNKHLFTLQQGISKSQLAEMETEHLTLVVPKSNISLFHPLYRHNIMSLNEFITMVRERQT